MALRIVIDVLMFVGFIFALAGTKGLFHMPDTFCRMQASTCVNTLGVIGVTIGALIRAILAADTLTPGTAVKIAVIGLLILVTNPIGSHALAKGAYKAGIRPETPMETDDLGRDSE